MSQLAHLQDDQLMDLVYGEVDGAAADQLHGHLRICEQCTTAFEGLGGVRKTMAALPPVEAPDAGLESLLAYAEQAARRAQAGSAPQPAWWRRVFLPAAGLASLAAVAVLATQVNKDLAPAVAGIRKADMTVVGEDGKEIRAVEAPKEIAFAKDELPVPLADGRGPLPVAAAPPPPAAEPSRPGAPAPEPAVAEAAGVADLAKSDDAKERGGEALARREDAPGVVGGLRGAGLGTGAGSAGAGDMGTSFGDKNALDEDATGGAFAEGKAKRKPAPAPKPEAPKKEEQLVAQRPAPVQTMKSLAAEEGTDDALEAQALASRGRTSATATATPSTDRAKQAKTAKVAEAAKPAEPDSIQGSSGNAYAQNQYGNVYGQTDNALSNNSGPGVATTQNRSGYQGSQKNDQAEAPRQQIAAAAPQRRSVETKKSAPRDNADLEELDFKSSPAPSAPTRAQPESSAELERVATEKSPSGGKGAYEDPVTRASDEALSAYRRGDRAREAKLLRQAIAAGAQGQTLAGLLNRLCDADLAVGNEAAGEAACARVVREFPNSGAAGVASRKMRSRAADGPRSLESDAPAAASPAKDAAPSKAPSKPAQSY